VPARAVAVTFDDGYADNYTCARPILDAFGIPATFFVTTDGIDAGCEYWWDLLAVLLRGAAAPSLELPVDLGHDRRTLPTSTAAERLAAYWTLYHGLVGLSAGRRDQIIDEIRRWSPLAHIDPVSARRMNGDMLREIAASGRHVVGAHSVSHEMLPRQSPAAQRRDAHESRRALERILDRPVATFAYPFGAYSAETIEAVRAASFDVAVTCDETPLGPDCDPLRVPRWMVTHARARQFESWIGPILGAAIR
jgi:peptidoglycan/xylan/chitin deacetylase (PgdA/CDA1 family)